MQVIILNKLKINYICCIKVIKDERPIEKIFTKKSTNDSIHVGNLIAWMIQEKHLKKKDVAQHLNVHSTTLTQYFKQTSVQVGILWRLSQALQYNLLIDLRLKQNPI